jgi:hypothetical protein
VTVDIFDMHHQVLVNLAGTRRAVLAGLTPEHEGAIRHDELGVTHDAIPFGPETLRESKGATEPVDRLADIRIDQERDNGCGGCGLIDHHVGALRRFRFFSRGLGGGH